jgi:hypothetical protein
LANPKGATAQPADIAIICTILRLLIFNIAPRVFHQRNQSIHISKAHRQVAFSLRTSHLAHLLKLHTYSGFAQGTAPAQVPIPETGTAICPDSPKRWREDLSPTTPC